MSMYVSNDLNDQMLISLYHPPYGVEVFVGRDREVMDGFVLAVVLAGPAPDAGCRCAIAVELRCGKAHDMLVRVMGRE